ncbi:MAG: glycosyltransferase family 2 protein [bacterium]|nr:glycosyltransferase family 2 protein [bacterium]
MVKVLVSAIVLNYRSPQDTVRCVEALQKQTVVDQLQIIVVDNHSEDDSIGVIRNQLGHMSNVEIVESSTNTGFGSGNNYAEQFADSDYILFINPDNALESSGLEKMLTHMQQHSEIGILAPQLVFADGTVRDSHRVFPSFVDICIKRTPLRRLFPKRLDRYLERNVNPQAVRQVDWVVGACFLISRALFADLGGYDERYFLFFEDTDLCRRCLESGKQVVYFPVVHALDRKQRLSGGGFFALFLHKTGRVHIASALKYFWKWRSA